MDWSERYEQALAVLYTEGSPLYHTLKELYEELQNNSDENTNYLNQ